MFVERDAIYAASAAHNPFVNEILVTDFPHSPVSQAHDQARVRMRIRLWHEASKRRVRPENHADKNIVYFKECLIRPLARNAKRFADIARTGRANECSEPICHDTRLAIDVVIEGSTKPGVRLTP